jgi:hypothetical protein
MSSHDPDQPKKSKTINFEEALSHHRQGEVKALDPKLRSPLRKILAFADRARQKKSPTSGDTPPLSAHIRYSKQGEREYGLYCQTTFGEDGRQSHEEISLGRVVNKEMGLFYNKRLGHYTFTLEKGIGQADPSLIPQDFRRPANMALHFGDVWLVDQTFKRIGLDGLLENLIPNQGDTLKSLIAFGVLEPVGYGLAEDWHRGSFARILYPEARLEPSQITKFHSELGEKNVFNKFFAQYLPLLTKNGIVSDLITNPILIDTFKSSFEVKTRLTPGEKALGTLGNDLRFFYSFDINSKLPIYFNFMPKPIFDYGNILSTTKFLNTNNINIKTVFINRNYERFDDILQSFKNNIPFITTIPKQTEYFDNIIHKYGKNLNDTNNLIVHDGKSFKGLKISTLYSDYTLYTYLMLDNINNSHDESLLLLKEFDDSDFVNDIGDKLLYLNTFIIASSENYDLDQILPIFYAGQSAGKIFDSDKYFADISPLNIHFYETTRACFLISFIAAIISSIINIDLRDSQYSVNKALYKLRNLMIKIYRDTALIDELDDSLVGLFKLLRLDCPFHEQKRISLQNNLFIENFNKDKTNPNDLPKFSLMKAKYPHANQPSQGPKCDGPKKGRPKSGGPNKGRPKSEGPKDNRANNAAPTTLPTDPSVSRGRGRPKGAKAKPKTTKLPELFVDSDD